MQNKIFFFLVLLFLFSCTQNENLYNSQKFSNSKIYLSTYQDTINYALGLIIGKNMKEYGIKDVDFNLFNYGIADALSDENNSLIDIQTARRLLALYLNKSYKQSQIDYVKQNSQFLIDNAKKKDVIVLPSGLQYKVLKKGNGISPTINDIVVVHYRGWLIDGTEVGNTFGKKPVRFAVNKSIKGWQIALTMMHEGDKWRIFLPPNLAFGKKGGKKIKPNSVVIYDIELLKVIKNNEK